MKTVEADVKTVENELVKNEILERKQILPEDRKKKFKSFEAAMDRAIILVAGV